MSDDPPAAVCDEKHPGRVVHAGGEAFRFELSGPTHVDARVPRPGVLGEQRATARDKPVHIGRLGKADDDLMLLITHTARRQLNTLTTT
ncbi:hypothetical protein [Streptomyces sp. GESEQ-13]|uniref:hypothetical protein n=1 Tax=Streptomyces sp. GESEQ-13 TaxID=2812654 RepID=UPI001FF0D94E